MLTTRKETNMLNTIKPQVHKIKTKDKDLEIKFTLESFAYLEEKFNSISEAIFLFNEKNEEAKKGFLKASLIHLKEENDSEIEFTDEILTTLANACSESISQDYSIQEGFDWNLLYYIARPALNLSEKEFWQSTPRKLLNLFKILEKYTTQFTQANQQKQAVEAFMTW